MDECATGVDLCVKEASDCMNKEGDYECLCKPGYGFEQYGSGRICIGESFTCKHHHTIKTIPLLRIKPLFDGNKKP